MGMQLTEKAPAIRIGDVSEFGKKKNDFVIFTKKDGVVIKLQR